MFNSISIILIILSLKLFSCNIIEIVFQNGREIKLLNGNNNIYTKSTDTSITTQYIDTWNNNNGITYFIGSTSTRYIAEESSQFRTLLKFSSLHQYIPQNATILESDITLSFTNWNSDAILQVCFITKPWNDHELNRYKDTGWRYNRWNPLTSTSESWTRPGGWSDCDSRVNITLKVPGNGAYGNVTRTITLDPNLVKEWLLNSGEKNYGLLFKAITGKVYLFSNSQNTIQYIPSLRISYTLDSNILPPQITYPITYTITNRQIYVSPNGNDITGFGSKAYPYLSPRKALFEAMSNDIINLYTGIYGGGLTIDKPNITLQSMENNFAVITSPRNDPISSNNVITIRSTAQGGIIRNLEIIGGYYYGIMFFSDWENYGSINDRVLKSLAPRNFLLTNLRIHHTGSSCIKMTMKVSNIKFISNEIYSCGDRYRNYGHGIEGVQSHKILIQDNYIHNISGAGIHLVGGSMYSIIQRNYISRTNFGMNIGFATEYEYMDPINNPLLYENLHSIISNNIITRTLQAGINLWAAKNSSIMFNTIWHVQEIAQNAIILNSYRHSDAPKSPIIGCDNINIIGNILTKSKTSRVGPIIQIRQNGLNNHSYFNMGSNIYYDEKSFATKVFKWGVGIMIEDERIENQFISNTSSWSKYCKYHLNQSYCDINSIESNPYLDSNFRPYDCSPTINRFSYNNIVNNNIVNNNNINQKLKNNIPIIYDDFNGNLRNLSSINSGAISINLISMTSFKLIPPIPKLFENIPAYNGINKGVDNYNQYTWPYQFWLNRQCKDLYVDSINGNDQQSFNYDSNYNYPFKTIQAALTNINQCDRILLNGGQIHNGPFGIYRPNVTIMTNPYHNKTAIVRCHNIGTRNCIMTGEGFYDGAASLYLINFKIIMSGDSIGDCIRLNEGYGGGFSPYWKFYVDTSNRYKYNRNNNTIISNIEMNGCKQYGIKLSTFISNVEITNTKIYNTKLTAIEIRNGNNVKIQNCYIENITSGIVMGGGSKNNLIESNIIKNYLDRGIIIGSDNTEVQYMDIDYVEHNIDGSWHDAINCTIRNNIIYNGVGAGISFYSAKDIIVTHNTLINVAKSSQAAILFNLSPKLIDYGVQLYPPNKNINFTNNIVQSASQLSLPMIESRIMPASIRPFVWPSEFPINIKNCNISQPILLQSKINSNNFNNNNNNNNNNKKNKNLELNSIPIKLPTGTQGRNSDGTCPQFPDNNLWHVDVSSYPVHPNSENIKLLISKGSRMHHDFGGGIYSNGKFIPYGIPFITINTKNPSSVSSSSSSSFPLQSLVPITISSTTGYPDESDYPLMYPFPNDAPIEGSYLNCPDSKCPGDRHVLVIDNSTCTLYETWRSFPPGVTGTNWVADIAVKWNLQSNNLRTLGYSSSDAAGLPVLPGLVQFDEVINKGEIKHALRFTGPNSRAAYSLPATHFAPTGNTGSDSPWMGMRIRLKSTFDCSNFARASKIFCIALQKYGGIFADNGSPWYFSGEATINWNPYLNELNDIGQITASDIEVLDSGCLCLNAECTISDCGNGIIDPNSLPVYSSIENYSNINLNHNIYYNIHGNGARFTDRRTGNLGNGYDGNFNGWKDYTKKEISSYEINPQLNLNTYRLNSSTNSIFLVNSSSIEDSSMRDFYGRKIKPINGMIEVGVIFGSEPFITSSPSSIPTSIPTVKPSQLLTKNPTIFPSPVPTKSPIFQETKKPSLYPTYEPTRKPSISPSYEPTIRPTREPTYEPSFRPSREPTKFPTIKPSQSPSFLPTKFPSNGPTTKPSVIPTFEPTTKPTRVPTLFPTKKPSVFPTYLPTAKPTRSPTFGPTKSPTRFPTGFPSRIPTK